jgi:hypothetical protein
VEGFGTDLLGVGFTTGGRHHFPLRVLRAASTTSSILGRILRTFGWLKDLDLGFEGKDAVCIIPRHQIVVGDQIKFVARYQHEDIYGNVLRPFFFVPIARCIAVSLEVWIRHV